MPSASPRPKTAPSNPSAPPWWFREIAARWYAEDAPLPACHWLDLACAPPHLVLGHHKLWVGLPEAAAERLTVPRAWCHGLDRLGIGDLVMVGRDAQLLQVGLVYIEGMACSWEEAWEDGEEKEDIGVALMPPFSAAEGLMVNLFLSSGPDPDRHLRRDAKLCDALLELERVWQVLLNERRLVGRARVNYDAALRGNVTPLPGWFLRRALPYLPLWFPNLKGGFAALESRLAAMAG